MEYKTHIKLVHELFNSQNDSGCNHLVCLIETSLDLSKGNLDISINLSTEFSLIMELKHVEDFIL